MEGVRQGERSAKGKLKYNMCFNLHFAVIHFSGRWLTSSLRVKHASVRPPSCRPSTQITFSAELSVLSSAVGKKCFPAHGDLETTIASLLLLTLFELRGHTIFSLFLVQSWPRSAHSEPGGAWVPHKHTLFLIEFRWVPLVDCSKMRSSVEYVQAILCAPCEDTTHWVLQSSGSDDNNFPPGRCYAPVVTSDWLAVVVAEFACERCSSWHGGASERSEHRRLKALVPIREGWTCVIARPDK